MEDKGLIGEGERRGRAAMTMVGGVRTGGGEGGNGREGGGVRKEARDLGGGGEGETITVSTVGAGDGVRAK